MDNNPPRHPVTWEIDGITFNGTYWITGKVLTFSTSKNIQVARYRPRGW